MTKKEKIFLVIIILLVCTNLFTFSLYLNMRKGAKLGLESTLNAVNEVYELNVKVNSLQEELNTLENQ